MTKKIFVAIALTTLLTGCAPGGESQNSNVTSPAPSSEVQTKIRKVTAVEASALLNQDAKIQVLDIRTPEEFETGHVEGAMLVNFKSSGFRTELAKLDRTTTYIVHCRSGGRSGKSMSAFKALGFENILHMNGGIIDWTNSQLPVVQ